jgi:hypothetical protein
MGFAFAVLSVGVSALQTCQCDYARYGSAYHTQTAYASAESCSYAQSCVAVHTIEVGIGCHYALAATKALHEEVYGQAHALFHFW